MVSAELETELSQPNTSSGVLGSAGWNVGSTLAPTSDIDT